MELFLDDPNNDVDSDERNTAMNIHLLGIFGSVLPPFNFLLPYIYSKSKANKTQFVKDHISLALNFQLLILIFMLIGIGMFFFIPVFYILLYALFLMMFQLFYSYRAYVSAKSGAIINKPPISLNIF